MKKNNYKLHGYISTNRSKSNLKAHIILVCKYRKKLLKGDLNNFVKAKIDEISQNYEFIILAIQSDIDHIHLMVQYLPHISISSLIQKIKQITTFYLWGDKRFEPFLRKHFWKEKTFLSR